MNEIILLIYKTALFLAVEKENLEIVKLLLNNDTIDVDTFNISLSFFLYNSKSIFSIAFKNIYSNEIPNHMFFYEI